MAGIVVDCGEDGAARAQLSKAMDKEAQMNERKMRKMAFFIGQLG